MVLELVTLIILITIYMILISIDAIWCIGFKCLRSGNWNNVIIKAKFGRFDTIIIMYDINDILFYILFELMVFWLT